MSSPIEVNPLSAAQSGSTRNQEGRETGKPTVIRNLGRSEAETLDCRGRQPLSLIRVSVVSKTFLFETDFTLNSRVNPNTLHNMSCNSHDLISWTASDRVDFQQN